MLVNYDMEYMVKYAQLPAKLYVTDLSNRHIVLLLVAPYPVPE